MVTTKCVWNRRAPPLPPERSEEKARLYERAIEAYTEYITAARAGVAELDDEVGERERTSVCRRVRISRRVTATAM